jgi:transcriptional regulator with XRE-family HTH domain
VEQAELQRRFGVVVRRHRLIQRLTQEDLADAASLHRTHVSLIERGEGMPTLIVIHKLAAAVKLTMAALMAEVESDEPPGEEPEEMPRGRPPREGK